MKKKTKKTHKFIQPHVLPIIGSISQRESDGELHITYKKCRVHGVSIMECGCWKKR